MNYLKRKTLEFQLNPPAVLAAGFLSLIIIGTILLSLPIASKNAQSIGFLDALFTASSAVCVTGLIVVNTAEHWSLFGQIVILILIQIGGLGIMTMATSVALIMGKKIRLKERLAIKEQLNQETIGGLVKLTKYVIFITFAIEFIGALLLSVKFIPIYGRTKGIWFSIFHSISAFCNAGFDILGNSIAPFVGDIWINIILCSLIILGGLGFAVYIDVYNQKRFKKLNIHSKFVLSMTGLLLLIGTVFFFLIEYNNPFTLEKLNTVEKITSSFFQSTVTRTAGFNSVSISSIKDTSAFLMIMLMFIGGSPASTAGGIKTTTFGTLILTTFSTIKGEKDVGVFNRRIGENVINKALAIIIIGLTWIITVSFILTITEQAVFLDVLFETTSAFATVGLTRGITPSLSIVGKILITITMYIGRVGALTMAFAFGRRRKHKKYREAEGNIIVG
ncbi:MAG: TrkH family potassium uptake protein [Tissierella sp.]|uniref:TrkH family potassium uptake protein n=1 Tax=Tissierella sp. TaxID=41274 RepID=UPI003F9B4412